MQFQNPRDILPGVLFSSHLMRKLGASYATEKSKAPVQGRIKRGQENHGHFN